MTEERTFDWTPRFDSRSLRFTYADHFGTDKPIKTRRRTQYVYLDQGNEGACVGFATAKALSQTPLRRKDIDDRIARNLYLRGKDLDEWEGNQYEGTSVLGVMKTVHEAGWVSAYYWATSLKQMQHAVSGNLGSLVVGINWYEGMWDSGPDGFIRAEGYWLGGHAVCFGGIDLKRQAFIVHNSWGPGWGGTGGAPKSSAFLSFADAERLVIREHGEAALMKKVTYKP